MPTSFQVGLHYRVGPGRILASVAHQNDRTASNSDATLFASATTITCPSAPTSTRSSPSSSNHNEAQFSPATAGAPGGFTPAPGEDGRAFQLGIRHHF